MEMYLKNGDVYFEDIEEMPGCCGISVIHGVSFSPKVRSLAGRRRLYDEFLKVIKDKDSEYKLEESFWGDNSYIPDSWSLNKYLMTDRVFDKAKPNTIQEFCEYTGWLGGTVTTNPNHRGHNIRCWEFDIEGTVK